MSRPDHYDDEYDDAYYAEDDAYYDEEGAPAPAAAAEVPDLYPDADLLNVAVPAVEAVVGESTFTEAAVVAALRACDYDVERSIGLLLDPPPPVVAKAKAKAKAPAPKATAAPAPAQKGKAKAAGPAHSAAPSAAGATARPMPSAESGLVNFAGAAAHGAATGGSSATVQPPPPMPAEPPELREWLVGGGRARMSVVVVGHVDAGKSTLMGRLLADLGFVAPRTVERLAKEARAAGKASFAYAWVLDEGATERARGVTVDVAVNHFDTPHCHFTLLDAPGHRDFVPSMITGAAQADVAVLVVAAAPGRFEAGFGEGGQTREHASLVRSLGVQHLVVAVNKLDAVGWSRARLDEVRAALLRFLCAIGFAAERIAFVPVAGLSGVNLVRSPTELLAALGESGADTAAAGGTGRGGGRGGALGDSGGFGDDGDDSGLTGGGADEPLSRDQIAEMAEMAADLGLGASTRRGGSDGLSGGGGGAKSAGKGGASSSGALAGVRAGDLRSLLAWYPASMPTLVQALDALPPPPRAVDKPLRLCVSDVYRPGGTAGGGVAVSGRIEGGWITPQTRVVIVPGGEVASVKSVSVQGAAVALAAAGDTVDIVLGGIDLDAGGAAAAQQVLSPGRVLCWLSHPLRAVRKFKAQISALPTLEMPLVAGQQFAMHCHALEEPCNVTRLLRTVDGGGRTLVRKPRLVAQGESCVVRVRVVKPVALETFAANKRLGRFVLRYGGVTVAAGRILKTYY